MRTENEVRADLATIDSVLANIRPDVSAEPLKKARRRYEAELREIQIIRRTANLNPRFAQLFMSTPLTRAVLEADPGYGDPQDMRLESCGER
jgi:hypothetical protein